MASTFDKAGQVMAAATHAKSGNHDNKQANGLSDNHEYTVLGVTQLKMRNGSTTNLFRMRNPWNKEYFKGNFHDGDSRWGDAFYMN